MHNIADKDTAPSSRPANDSKHQGAGDAGAEGLGSTDSSDRLSAFTRHSPASALWISLLAGICAAALVVAAVSAAGIYPFPGIGSAIWPVLALAGALLAGFLTWILLRAVSGDRRRLELFAELLANAPDGCVIAHYDGTILATNARYRAIVGGGPFGDLSSSEAVEGAAQKDDAKTPQPLPTDIPGLGPRARHHLLEMKAKAEADPAASESLEVELGDGRAIQMQVRSVGEDTHHLLWSVQDITREHEERAAARAAHTRLHEFLERMPIGFCAIDRQGALRFVNGRVADWCGRSDTELAEAQATIFDVLLFDDRAKADLDLIFQGESKTIECEATLQCADGSQQPVIAILHGSGEEASATPEIPVIIRERTDDEDWKRRFDDAEAHFRRFFEVAPVGIAMLDSDHRVLEGNPAFLRISGFEGEQAEKRAIADFVSAEDREQLRVNLDKVLAGEAIDWPVEVKLSGEAERIVRFYANRLEGTGPDKTVEGLLLHVLDATEQKNLEDQFTQSQKMQAVGQLAGGVAHDFNNLLTAMIGFCDLLLLRHQPGDQSFSDIMQIKQNANRAANLVRQLLAFSRQQTLRPRVTMLTDVLAELSNLLRRLIGEKIQLKLIHARDLGLVKVDPSQLEQVIINLVVNARDAMPGGGTLTIRTSNVTVRETLHGGPEPMPPGEYIRTEVIDTGHGIPAEVIDKIFEPFFTTKEVGAGTGLGLSTVYGIVKQTGGFIVPANNRDGGTTFSIYLPRHVPKPEESAAAADEEAGKHRDLTGKGTILLVEDEDPVRVFAARALRNKGYTVLEADSGESALEIVAEHSGTVDLCITDVVMPSMDGPTLVKKLREDQPNLKIVFISGYAEDTFRRDLGSDVAEIAFLPKPFSLKEIAGKVKEVLRETV